MIFNDLWLFAHSRRCRKADSLSIPGTVQMHDGQESELKFFFGPKDLSKIKALPLLKDALPQANYQRLVSTFSTRLTDIFGSME